MKGPACHGAGWCVGCALGVKDLRATPMRLTPYGGLRRGWLMVRGVCRVPIPLPSPSGKPNAPCLEVSGVAGVGGCVYGGFHLCLRLRLSSLLDVRVVSARTGHEVIPPQVVPIVIIVAHLYLVRGPNT